MGKFRLSPPLCSSFVSSQPLPTSHWMRAIVTGTGWLEAGFSRTEAKAGRAHNSWKWQNPGNKARDSAAQMQTWRQREGQVCPKGRRLRSGLQSWNLQLWSKV